MAVRKRHKASRNAPLELEAEDPGMFLRFYKYIQIIPSTNCWEWIGAKNNKLGYGSFGVGAKVYLAHRVSWLLHHREMPHPKVSVCHKCDNPPCVNPDHLWLGSQRDNTIDCIRKGRGNRAQLFGERNPMFGKTRTEALMSGIQRRMKELNLRSLAAEYLEMKKAGL